MQPRLAPTLGLALWVVGSASALAAEPASAPAAAGPAPAAAAAPTYKVTLSDIDDMKSVYATVRSKDLIPARVRTPGTIASLKVDEGDSVQPGQVLALVADPKIALQIKALDAQIVATQSRIDTAKAELDRAEALRAKGVSTQTRVEQAQTAFDVATNELKSTKAQRSVVETQIEEGQVLSPAAGRVLKVPVTVGSVVMAGEAIATIAANEYLLRLELPERHARFMKVGDVVHLGQRSDGSTTGMSGDTPGAEGRITLVYPELSNGRVVADAEVPNLGTYFVGERVLVWISAGKRQGFVVPRGYIFRRFGLDYARVETDGGKAADVVVQLGSPQPGKAAMTEILSGLKAGDVLVQP